MAELNSGLLPGMTVAITGASGNVGTAVLRSLADTGVAEVRGLARRRPPEEEPYAGVRWYRADLGSADSEPVLAEFLDGVDAVVHLAWALTPDREPEVLHAVNVEGTRRVLDAAGAAGVRHVVHMSSIGTYAAGPQTHPVREDWPTTGVPSSQYSRQKVQCEQDVRDFDAAHPGTTVSVTRPTLVLQPDAASEIGRYFLGPVFFPAARALPGAVAKLLPLPLPSSLHLGFVHADDVADAIARILDRRAPGPFNLSAPPNFDADGLAGALGVRRVPVPAPVLRTGMQAAFLAHLLQIEPGWLDLGLGVPPLDTTRARTDLEWVARHRGGDLLREFVAALGKGQGHTGPLLHAGTGPEHTPA
ncbi:MULTISPECIES: NAD-dependent epimerase/dehydratase family protein [unclassified Modestobacter]|uniref:NAD-dependent epimerase/dehydratase family protein n=1 Tax=unclassified Modestobacter TaxID=2643866 RepID=UPI0022AB0BAE|nr:MULTISPECIES: NAD-dependent epimerase/dehydratase family protein [unclassified Modestobacter]MCZ2824397.1 NAD-dependent epimerase/dehydratase family protein [Modestobacter sp. VKM Ac-2981]MCZ2854075.1 NAD-dependent epimerase/dehydratase family protein [Modestobacter sp. VKM Ac-2982]